MAKKNVGVAESFLKLVAKGKVDDAYKKYVDEKFKHHNPYFPGDRESLRQAMMENAQASPEKTVEIKLGLEDGDMVAVYSRIRQRPDDEGAAVVYLFRIKAGKIVEMWDIGQPVPRETVNLNGMF